MIDEKISSPNQSSRNGHKPQLIVCHICDGTYEGTKSWFLNKSSETSSHYIVSKTGKICQCVPIDKMAWCNGTSKSVSASNYYGNSKNTLINKLGGNVNEYSVSIEFEGYYKDTHGELTAPQIDSAVWLMQDIQNNVKRIYGHVISFTRDYIIGHYEINPVTRKNCPGELFQWNEIIDRLNSSNQIEEKPIYRIQVGAFSVKENAENMLKQLKEIGIDGYIVKGD